MDDQPSRKKKWEGPEVVIEMLVTNPEGVLVW